MNNLENNISGGSGGNTVVTEEDHDNKTSMEKKDSNLLMNKVINGLMLSLLVIVTFLLRSNTLKLNSEQGFYCGDQSLRYPIRPQTVSTKVLILSSFLGSLFLFSLLEYLNVRIKKYPSMTSMALKAKPWSSSFNKTLLLPSWIGPSFRSLLLCFIGSMANSILTDIGKKVIGWPRPNFMALCQPNVTCVAGSLEFITQFTCLNAKEKDDLFMSFPSAHASFAAFMAFYLVLYIHERFKHFNYATRSITAPFLQIFLLAIYWWSALTRVSDFVHHPTDVLAGLLLGTLVAFWTWPHMVDMLQTIDQGHKTAAKFGITS